MRRNKKTKIDNSLLLQFLSRKDYLTAILVSILTFGVYAFTAAPGVTLEDSGDFIIGVLTLGIVHTPGYPLYTVLGHLFSLIPLGEPAFRVNLFSALWGALCLGVMVLNLRILIFKPIFAVFASLLLGFTSIFWSKTAVAEVYTFNAFLLAVVVFWMLNYNRDKKKWQLYLTALTTGLALSNHYPLVILSSVGLVFLLDWRGLRPTDYLKGFMFLLLGLTPYLYLFIQALNPDIPYNFGKNSDWGMVLDHILRKDHHSEYGGAAWDNLVLACRVLKAMITNFLFSSLFLFSGIAIGFFEKWRYRYPFLVAALSTSFVLILLLSFPSDDLEYTSYLLDYMLTAFLFFSFFLALGLEKLSNRYVKNVKAQVLILLLLLISQVGFNFQKSSHHNDRLAEIWGNELLNSLAPSSILILCSRSEDMALYYLQLVKGVRQDVTMYDRFSFWTKDNLYEPALLYKMDHALFEYRRGREQQLINTSPRPVYYTCKDAVDDQNIEFSSTPFAFRVKKDDSQSFDDNQFTVGDGLLDSIVKSYPKSEYWLDFFKREIFNRLITYYGGHERPDVNRILQYFTKTEFSSDPKLSLTLAHNLHYFKNYDLARQFYERAEKLSLEAFSTIDLAIFCNLLAKDRNYDKALGICIRQEQSSDSCAINTIKTRQRIAAIYGERADWPKVVKYSRKILECQPNHKMAQRYLKLATERIK